MTKKVLISELRRRFSNLIDSYDSSCVSDWDYGYEDGYRAAFQQAIAMLEDYD